MSFFKRSIQKFRRNYDPPRGTYGYPQQQPYYTTYDHQTTPQLHPNPSQHTGDVCSHKHHQEVTARSNRKKFQRTFSRITDDYKTLDEVTAALADAGLESSNLIVGIDFTKSNEWTGKRSFNRLNLHHIGDQMNPYEQAISIIGRSLSSFDEDNLIPCFGFGDASTHDQDVFSFYPEGHSCNGFEDVLSRYREILPYIRLSGPTSFAPIIEMAMTIVEESGGQYHVLLIIADGQVTRSVNTEPGRYSFQEQTVDAIVRASHYPLSIVLVGVGDGPWDMMKEFYDHIPQRVFDNFHFVNFTEIMSKNTNQMKKEMEFALASLMEIPQQYRATLEHDLLGRRTGRSPGRVALPPPSGTNKRISSFDQTKSERSESTITEATYSTEPPSNRRRFDEDTSPQQVSSLVRDENFNNILQMLNCLRDLFDFIKSVLDKLDNQKDA